MPRLQISGSKSLCATTLDQRRSQVVFFDVWWVRCSSERESVRRVVLVFATSEPHDLFFSTGPKIGAGCSKEETKRWKERVMARETAQ